LGECCQFIRWKGPTPPHNDFMTQAIKIVIKRLKSGSNITLHPLPNIHQRLLQFSMNFPSYSVKGTVSGDGSLYMRNSGESQQGNVFSTIEGASNTNNFHKDC
jgi:hypothetical protein